MSLLSKILQFKYAPPIFISLILLVGHFSFGILESSGAILLSIGVSIVTELVLSRVMYGEWRKNVSSAYITGISIAMLIRSTFLWPFALAAVLSIMSKYVLKYQGRHIWNPSNFGLSWLFFFAPFSVAGLSIQWGNNILPMLVIWLLGIVIVLKAKRLHITLTYVIAFLFFAWLRSLITGASFFTEVAPLTGPMYQLFVFFMITDPGTTVKNRKGQMLVAFLVAFVEFILRLNEFIYAPFYALFLVGPIAMVIYLYLQKKSADKSPVEQ